MPAQMTRTKKNNALTYEAVCLFTTLLTWPFGNNTGIVRKKALILCILEANASLGNIEIDSKGEVMSQKYREIKMQE